MCVCVCVYSECVTILLRWVLELFTFCERLGSEYQKGDARPFLLGVVLKNVVRCLTW